MITRTGLLIGPKSSSIANLIALGRLLQNCCNYIQQLFPSELANPIGHRMYLQLFLCRVDTRKIVCLPSRFYSTISTRLLLQHGSVLHHEYTKCTYAVNWNCPFEGLKMLGIHQELILISGNTHMYLLHPFLTLQHFISGLDLSICAWAIHTMLLSGNGAWLIGVCRWVLLPFTEVCKTKLCVLFWTYSHTGRCCSLLYQFPCAILQNLESYSCHLIRLWASFCRQI